VIKAGLETEHFWLVAVALLVGILTLYSMVKIWAEAFLKAPPETTTATEDQPARRLAFPSSCPASAWLPSRCGSGWPVLPSLTSPSKPANNSSTPRPTSGRSSLPARHEYDPIPFLPRHPPASSSAAFYLWEVLISNLRVALDVLTPRHRMQPAFLQVNVEGFTDRQLLAMANLLTMTPGTLSVDVSPDGKCLLVHAMYVDDPVAEARHLEKQFKQRICHVF
jgi:multicomponent Na+:H+ antiporter subunit E